MLRLPKQQARKLVLACALVAAYLHSAPVAAETVQLSLEQGLMVARQALLVGNPALARGLALGLLQANAQDPYALLILSAAETQLGNPAAGRKAGKAAWRAARATPAGMRYDIARHTALAALRQGKSLPAQFWLRRALDLAPTDADHAQTVADFRDISARARLHFSADLSITPTDNLNDGASGKYLTIDDWFVLGMLSGSAQALSGMRASADLKLSYRIAESARARTTLGLRTMFNVNALSAEAKRLAPDLRATDLNSSKVEISLTQDFLWPQSQQPISLGFALGEIWNGGAASGNYLRLEGTTPLLRAEKTALMLRAFTERQWRDDSQIGAAGLAFDARHRLTSGTLSLGLSATTVAGSAINQDYQRGALSLGFTPSHPLGPVSLSVSVSAAVNRYDIYSLLGAQVTNGRTDHQLGAEVDFSFQDISIMGYAPKLTIATTQTRSNISRFQGQALNVSFGFESQF